jgi:hypothetical protein
MGNPIVGFEGAKIVDSVFFFCDTSPNAIPQCSRTKTVDIVLLCGGW